jgi:putative transposase
MNLLGLDLLKLKQQFHVFPWGKLKWDTFTRTEQIWLEHNDALSQLCHFSKNLWNEANYRVRKDFFSSGKWTRYNTLAGNFKTSDNFKSLNAQTGQQILKILDRSWKSFFKSIKEWKKNPEKFLGKPKLPGYKEKSGEFMLVFTNQQVKIDNSFLIFPDSLGIQPVKTRLGDDTKIREARIIPKGTGYLLEIVYQKELETLDLNPERTVGIDFGLRNIVAIGNNIGDQPIVVKGDVIKSVNQYYNKKRAEIQSIYDRKGIKTGAAIQKLTATRNRKIKDAMHKVGRYIINLCISRNIGTIVIGYNENWKQEAELGKRNNQNFVSIPYYILMNQIKYKAEEAGITVIEQDESHTSKCSFLDNESTEHHNKYMGKRVKRGIFRSAKGILINADVQGALNIIRKAVPKAFPQGRADGIEGVGLHPKRVNIKKILSFAVGS